MNSKLKIALIALAVVIVLALGVLLISLLTGGGDEPENTAAPGSDAPATVAPAGETEPAQTTEPGETPDDPENLSSATIAVGGDLLMHTGLNNEALGENGYDYSPIFGVLPDLVAGSDYAVCSLSTTLASEGEYMGYPLFRTPDALASAIAGAGFDLVNTATSHLADSWKDGIDHTLDVLDANGLAHVGTYRSAEERESSGNRTVVEINGINVAFLAYTCDTNAVPVTGFEYAASICATDYLSGGREIDYALMESDIAAAREAGADAVFVFMSWGDEFATEPTDGQLEITDRLFEYGADVIIGGHCRVPQRMETREITLDDGTTKTGFVCYSLGNLLSCQNDEYTDISALLSIRLEKNNDTGLTEVAEVSFRPIYMADLYDYGINDFGWHYRIVDLHAAIDAWDSGSGWDFMTTEIYTDMVIALDAAHELYGGEYDPLYTAEEG